MKRRNLFKAAAGAIASLPILKALDPAPVEAGNADPLTPSYTHEDWVAQGWSDEAYHITELPEVFKGFGYVDIAPGMVVLNGEVVEWPVARADHMLGLRLGAWRPLPDGGWISEQEMNEP